jgi:hypothetical protein
VLPLSRSLLKRRITGSKLRWVQEKRRVGVQLTRKLKRSSYSSISRKRSDASHSFSRKPRQHVHKSSSCDGLRMADAHFEKLCASRAAAAPQVVEG